MLIKINDNYFKRNKTSKQYVLDNKEYNTPGRGKFTELEKIGLGDVNFQNQQTSPFLLFETPSNKYKYIIGEKDNKLIEVADNMKQDINSLKSFNKTKVKELTQKEEKAKETEKYLEENRYKELTELKNKINLLIAEKEKINNIKNKLDKVNIIEEKHKSIELINQEKLNELDSKITHFNKIKKILIQKETLNNIVSKISNIKTVEESKINNLKVLLDKSETLLKLSIINEKEEEYNLIKTVDENKINDLKEQVIKKETLDRILKNVSGYKKRKKELNMIEKEIEKTKEEEIKIKDILQICPLCGSRFSECTD